MNRSSDSTDKSRPNHPFDNANVISKFFYWWLRDLFKIGLARQVGESDMYECVAAHKSEKVSNKFQRAWDDELTKEKPSLMRVIMKVYINKVILAGVVFSAFELPCKMLSPLFMGYLIAYFMDNPYNHTEQDAYLFATGLSVSLIVTVLVFHPAQLYYFHSSLKLRVACCSLIYNKILSLTKYTTTDGLAGQAINLLSNDVSRFDYMICFICNLWNAPLGSAIAGYFIFQQIGISGLVGIAVLVFSMPGQAWLGKKSAEIRMETALRTDKRVKFMYSILNGIQVVKMYAWENSFANIIKAIRKLEIRAIGKSFNIKAALLSFQVSTEIAIFLSLMTFVYLENDVTAQKVFVTIAYFNYINNTLVEYWPYALTAVAEGVVSIKRVEEFLLHKTSQKSQLNEKEKEAAKSSLQKGIVLRNASAYWDQNESSNIGILSVDANIGGENLTAVIGQVGSGKTTLLEVVLKELPLTDGEIEVNGSVSYAAQQSWIYEGSIKNNIVFTSGYDEKRYKAVVHACALERDFELWPHGDETIVGDRGVSLSGGQKARISLARAVYKKADIYLLDDPLSAVDVHVGKHLFEKCIKEFLSDKICVLVTHQLQYLHDVKHIIVMNMGRIQNQGTFEHIKESETDLSSLLNAFESGTEKIEEIKNEEDTEKSADEEQHISKETQQVGKVTRDVYKQYLLAVNNFPFVAIVLLLLLAAQVLQSSVSYFISVWVNWEEKHNNGDLRASNTNIWDPLWWTTDKFIMVYGIAVAALTFIVICRSFGFYRMCLRISTNLHDKLFRGVTRATMFFFHANATGRILNRFSKDMGSIDSSLPVVVIDCLKFFLELAGIVTIVAIVNYWLLVPTFIMFLIFAGFRYLFLKTARDVKRIEAITRSPMFTHTTATLEGLSTIRALKAQPELIREYDQHQNLNSSASFLFVATSRGFAFYIDFTSSLYITTVIYSFLVLGTDTVGANIGLAITQAINLIGICNWGLRQTAELENQMTSVERVVEYTKLPRERALETDPETLAKLPKPWPNRGVIKFRNVSLKYSQDGDYVLRNLSFDVKEKEKIGIVGRTGAGKSSITQAIFHLAIVDGVIEIDDFDLNSLGLHTFREKISMIPQDPILFVGSLRDNLDPLREKVDDELWQALEQVEMKQAIKILSGGLETKISDGGSNFSSGQKQLICLARAILKNNNILIMDEATANIDSETDNLIQATIRNQFKDCTIITVAHRLHTVMDSDRIMVMDHGSIMEFDTPRKLLENPRGYFAKLVSESGLDIGNFERMKR